VELNDWLLALHLLSAFAFVAALVLFTVLIVASRDIDTPGPVVALAPVGRVGNVIVAIGSLGTIIFGVWLAISDERYQVWDGWVIAAIVLWAVGSGIGARAGKEYELALHRARELQASGETGPSSELLALNRTSRGLLFHTIASIALLLVLIDMVWKPGA
jgi:uncharacterized membrane protein